MVQTRSAPNHHNPKSIISQTSAPPPNPPLPSDKLQRSQIDSLSTTPTSTPPPLPRTSRILLNVLSTFSLNGSQIKILLGLPDFMCSHSGEKSPPEEEVLGVDWSCGWLGEEREERRMLFTMWLPIRPVNVHSGVVIVMEQRRIHIYSR